MADNPTRRAAAAAARKLLRPKLDRISEIAEAARTIELAVQARDAANRHIADCQQAYTRARRAALDTGWTEAELRQLGWDPVTTHHQQRRRSAAQTRTPRQPVSDPTQAAPSAAAEHPDTEHEWANTTDEPVPAGPVPTEPVDTPGAADACAETAFVDSVQAATSG